MDSYAKLAEKDEVLATFLQLMSLSPNSFTSLSKKIDDDSPESILNLTASSNKKIVLAQDLTFFENYTDMLWEENIRVLTWNEIVGDISKVGKVLHVKTQNLNLLTEVNKVLNKELANYYSKNPNSLKSLSPRNFEKLVSEIIEDMGFTTVLTPETRDGGKDIIAEIDTPLSKFTCYIECKKYSEKNKIGIDILERFLYNIQIKDKVNQGFIVTTSTFSNDAKMLAKQNQFILQLADLDKVTEWLTNYGEWSPGTNNLWLRNI